MTYLTLEGGTSSHICGSMCPLSSQMCGSRGPPSSDIYVARGRSLGSHICGLREETSSHICCSRYPPSSSHISGMQIKWFLTDSPSLIWLLICFRCLPSPSLFLTEFQSLIKKFIVSVTISEKFLVPVSTSSCSG